MKNCNECKHINVTESAQHRLLTRPAHKCTKYNRYLMHGNRHRGQDINCFIKPCGECIDGDFSAFVQHDEAPE